MSVLGRLDPFAEASANDRYLREANGGSRRETDLAGRPSGRLSWVGGPTGGDADAYAGVSSTMRPSLQPYLASKSAFTMTAK
jgi:hypothetical protein